MGRPVVRWNARRRAKLSARSCRFSPALDRAIVKRIAINGDNWKRVAKRFRLRMGEVKKRYFESLEKLCVIALAAAEATDETEGE